ncbi:hypothetical protein OMP38_08565 [Cohnella ginsengisoli]|uniref:Gfo/Idh/MocA-like oxidoreductase N-terminal domain-containing protein n=1 Tax=Cohnella ginsengisoli TaxID=425004 RepID=A0A9X4QM87_9BACL|nr:hypothetical protein [Cohnella ginsengisoli]MDG0790912.1 hypothetical protein [Cohnella ginsengisoli]
MKKLKVGMIGLGEIAQIIHLPILQSMPDRFELVALCDVSPGLLALMGKSTGLNICTPALRRCSTASTWTPCSC